MTKLTGFITGAAFFLGYKTFPYVLNAVMCPELPPIQAPDMSGLDETEQSYLTTVLARENLDRGKSVDADRDTWVAYSTRVANHYMIAYVPSGNTAAQMDAFNEVQGIVDMSEFTDPADIAALCADPDMLDIIENTSHYLDNLRMVYVDSSNNWKAYLDMPFTACGVSA